MSECKRCGVNLEWENGKPMSNGITHEINKCSTKPGYVYCPSCKDIFLKYDACQHYKFYGYIGENGENFFINLIRRKYKPGDGKNKYYRKY